MAVAPNSREKILEAARDSFIAGGGEIEMSDIAKRAGVSIGLAYHYFGSKAGLVSALITDFYDRYDAVVNQRYERGLSWQEREYRRLRDAVRFLFVDPLAPIMLGRLSGNAQVMAVEATRCEAIIELAVINIRKGQERGEIDPALDPEMAAAAINGGLRTAIGRVLGRPGATDPEQCARQLWGFIAGGLALKDGKAP